MYEFERDLIRAANNIRRFCSMPGLCTECVFHGPESVCLLEKRPDKWPEFDSCPSESDIHEGSFIFEPGKTKTEYCREKIKEDVSRNFSIEIAKKMIMYGEPVEYIEKYTKLLVHDLKPLAEELGKQLVL